MARILPEHSCKKPQIAAARKCDGDLSVCQKVSIPYTEMVLSISTIEDTRHVRSFFVYGKAAIYHYSDKQNN